MSIYYVTRGDYDKFLGPRSSPVVSNVGFRLVYFYQSPVVQCESIRVFSNGTGREEDGGIEVIGSESQNNCSGTNIGRM